MPAKSKPDPDDVKLTADEDPGDAFPPDKDISVPPPGSDRTLGAEDPDAGGIGRPRKPE